MADATALSHLRACAPDPVDRPCRVADVIECDVRDELLVYGPALDRAMALNASARAIWSLCDGQRSIAEMAETLASPLGLPRDVLLEDVGRAVDEFRRAGLLQARD